MPSPLHGSRARAVICAIVAAAAFLMLVAEVRIANDVRLGWVALAGRAGP